MSEEEARGGLWVTGPQTLWVAEDHVLALADFLAHLARDIDRVAAGLQALPDPLPGRGDLSFSVLPAAEIRRAGARVAGSAEAARRLERALWAYARGVADQERARVAWWDYPRDWLLAVSVVTATGTTPSTPLGQWGVQEAARAILTEGLDPSGIQVERVASGTAEPPRGLADRVDRIPSGEAAIRIERFRDEVGGIHTEVYIAGTRDFGIPSDREPFDMESNIALIGALAAASLVAVESAMRQAGVRPGDAVVFTGHSQGGLVAARLAESGRYDTKGLVMVGAPRGSAPIRGDYPAVSLAHTDDVVPDLGGARRASKEIQLERSSGQPPGDIVGAHDLGGYRETARVADASPSAPRWANLPTPAGNGAATDYRATRS